MENQINNMTENKIDITLYASDYADTTWEKYCKKLNIPHDTKKIMVSFGKEDIKFE